MNKCRPKALLIVEGDRLEPAFFRRWEAVEQRLSLEIYAFKTNISILYDRMKQEDFDCNIKDLLLSSPDLKDEEKEILRQDYAETYLVFDCDLQHTHTRRRDHELTPTDAHEVLGKVLSMVRHLNNETDPTRGKLYVNYPMMESYRDANTFQADACPTGLIPLSEVPRYKQRVGTRRLCSIHPDSYSAHDFEALAKMNVERLARLKEAPQLLSSYKAFRNCSSQCGIARLQHAKLGEGLALVLNTSLFFSIDYLGKAAFEQIMGMGPAVSQSPV